MIASTTAGPVIPFRIDIPQAALDDLQARLARVRWPDELPGVGDSYGIPLARMKELVARWQHGYDWRVWEQRLNTFRPFATTIDGQRIFFLHVESPEPDALPLILTHGWPGSILEFIDVIEPLTNPRAFGGDPADAFHVVVPAIPGYSFSGPTTEPGWTVRRIATAWAALMTRLGYERFGAQGGDWGSGISRDLAVVAPERVIGVHLNYLPTPPPPDAADLTADEQERVDQLKRYIAQPSGYLQLQMHRPQTLAYALADSPVAQLAWIADRVDAWRDSSRPIDDDWLLTNVMLYWLTGTGGSAARLHAASAGERGRPQPPSPAPIGVAVFRHDIVRSIRRFAEATFDVRHWSEFDRGGHFAAVEAPDLLTGDIRAFFRLVRPTTRS